MIRFTVGAVLLFYFLGADTFARYRPPVIGDSMAVFHRQINRGTWKVVGPSVTYVRDLFASDDD
jgi:hypothetical protein